MYVGDAHVHHVAVAEPLYELRLHHHRAALDEHALPLAPVLAEERQLARAFEVFYRDEAARLAGLSELAARRRDNASQHHFLLLCQLLLVGQLGAMRVTHVVEYYLEVVERVGRQVNAYEVALLVELLYGAPCFALGYLGRGYVNAVHVAEERVLRRVLLLLVKLSVAHERVEEHLSLGVAPEVVFAPDVEAVESAAEGEALEAFAVAGREVDALHHVEHVFIRAVLFALGYDGLGCCRAHAFYRGQAEADGSLLIYAELLAALVDVGPERLYAHGLALVHELCYFGYVGDVAAHVGCHVLGRVVSLEVSRLVSHPRVARGVTLVEGVAGELLPVFPNLVQHLVLVAVLLAAFIEEPLQVVHLLNLLLAHRLAQGVALASRRSWFSPSLRIVICIPSGSTEVEIRAVRDSSEHAGGRDVYMIYEPMAAALGIGLDVEAPEGNMIVDIGGGTTEIAVISLGGIVTNKSIRIAGDVLTDDIQEHMRRAHNVRVGERMAELIKINVGSVLTELENPPEDYIVHGPNVMTALPMEVAVSYQEISRSIEKSISKIEAAVLNALENTPPELYADIVRNGIYLSGGGALLRGLDKRLTDKIGIKFNIADDPLHAVAKGTGIALKNIGRFSFLIR